MEENKQRILRLMYTYNPAVDEMVAISWLHDEARRLTDALTSEIRCEEQIIPCKRTEECKFIFLS